jgi:hypothetical protein
VVQKNTARRVGFRVLCKHRGYALSRSRYSLLQSQTPMSHRKPPQLYDSRSQIRIAGFRSSMKVLSIWKLKGYSRLCRHYEPSAQSGVAKKTFCTVSQSVFRTPGATDGLSAFGLPRCSSAYETPTFDHNPSDSRGRACGKD